MANIQHDRCAVSILKLSKRLDCHTYTETVIINHVLHVGPQQFGQDIYQDPTEVTVKIFNEGTGLVLSGHLYMHTWSKIYQSQYSSFGFLRLLSSLNCKTNGVVHLLGYVH